LSSRLTPISRRELVKRLKKIGFEGPYPGSDHEYMVRGIAGHRAYVRVPNPHGDDISVDLVARILRDGEISREEWDSSA